MHENFRNSLNRDAKNAHVDYYGEHLSRNERDAICSMLTMPSKDNFFLTVNDLPSTLIKHRVGDFTPTISAEYPDGTGEENGAYWVVSNLTSPYTFSGGNNAGSTVYNGDYLMLYNNKWIIDHKNVGSSIYYKLNGTLALTANFDAGNFQLKNIADGVDDSDAVSISQFNTELDKKVDKGQNSFFETGGVDDNVIPQNKNDKLINSPLSVNEDGDVELSSNLIGNVTIKKEMIVTRSVGGIDKNTVYPSGTSIQKILFDMLSKALDPIIGRTESLLSEFRSNTNTYLEIGSTFVNKLDYAENRGYIVNANDGNHVDLKGEFTIDGYSGAGIDNGGNINTVINNGNNIWTISGTFATGTDPYYDSNGIESHVLDGSRNSVSLSSSKKIIGIYPKFYGMTSVDLINNTDKIETELTKDVSPVSGLETVTFNGTNKYAYIILPSGNAISVIKDQNGYDVTDEFEHTTISLTTGLYTAFFEVYKTGHITINNNTYTIWL